MARFALVVLAAGTLAALTVALVAPLVVAILGAHETSPTDTLDLDPLSQRSLVLDAKGRELAALHREENRAEIPLGRVPEEVVDTILAVEDDAFYSHGGLNLRATMRALFTNVQAGETRQGGSTITQQLVKNALLDADQSLDRKVREAVLAVRLEDQLSKDQILERYLNTVYLGNGAYGLQAAAETYFGKSAEDLDRTDAALLAGLIRNPVGYDPFREPEIARQRREIVVARLLEVGQIDDDEAEAIRATPLPEGRQTVRPKPNDYFVNDVIRRLLDDERLGETQNDRYNLLFKGGLTIKTTLDLDQQARAIAALQQLPESEFTAALVAVEPGTGAVRALVGGEGFEQSKFNIATQGPGRQAGSAFKPFVLAAALEAGISPRSTINGSGPCRFPNPGGTPDPYEVENFEGATGGTVDLVTATTRSYNCAYVRLGLVVGVEDVMRLAARAGITTELRPVVSAPLGTNEVWPIDMAAAYATFANDGVWVQPHLVTEVLDRDGKVIFRAEPERRRAMSPATARAVTDILERNVKAGTGTRARFRDGRPAAGKTGTTQAHTDAWFVGYTKQLVASVWMGHPKGKVPMRNVGGVARVTGGSWPARVWQAFMGPAMEGRPIERFDPPPPYGPSKALRVKGEPGARPRRSPAPTVVTEPVGEPVEEPTETTEPGPEPEPEPEPGPEPAPEEPPEDGGGNGNKRGKDGGDTTTTTTPTSTTTTTTTTGADTGQTGGSG